MARKAKANRPFTGFISMFFHTKAATVGMMKKGEITNDGLFTLTEVECLGACANAPMVQVNDDNYEDLTYETMTAILNDLIAGRTPKVGSQIGSTASCPEGGATTLKETA